MAKTFVPGEILTATDVNNFLVNNILQVVTSTDSTMRETTSSSFSNAGISASITPSKAGNIIIAQWVSTFEGRVEPGISFDIATRILAADNPITGAENNTVNIRAAQAAIANVGRLQHSSVGIYTTVGTSAVSFVGQFRITVGTTAILRNDSNAGLLILTEVNV